MTTTGPPPADQASRVSESANRRLGPMESSKPGWLTTSRAGQHTRSGRDPSAAASQHRTTITLAFACIRLSRRRAVNEIALQRPSSPRHALTAFRHPPPPEVRWLAGTLVKGNVSALIRRCKHVRHFQPKSALSLLAEIVFRGWFTPILPESIRCPLVYSQKHVRSP